ncbi:hypothetical protein [Oceanobacillus sp. CF4.6]|uniref:hypothetical protein n=1 Tax=Oceanobacillus sp. CF4.6 TaxID=3373080 RepID=UPI003EE773CC
MGVEKVLNEYKEFQVILFNLDSKWEINESLSLIDIRTEDKISIQVLKKLNNLVGNFEIYCNPFTDDCKEIIEDLERKFIKIEEIESISIQLDKRTDLGNLDYYFFDEECALKSIQNVNSTNKNQKLIIGIPEIDFIETGTILFVPLNKKVNLDSVGKISIDEITQENIRFYLSNNKRDKHNFYFNPYSFIISEYEESNTNNFINLIKQFFYLTMLDCLADKKEQSNFVIRGEKSISILRNMDFTTSNYNSFVDIFNFLISAKRFTEKYIIIKKVFSIYIADEENISSMDVKLSNIWKTITHYYNHYIEDSLEDFFETKDKLLKEAMNASKVIYEQTDKLYTTIIASLLSLIIVFVTTLYRSMSNLTITYFSSLLLLFMAFSIVYYVLMNNSAKQRFAITKEQFLYFLNEVSLMEEQEIKNLKKTYLDRPFKVLTDTLNMLKKVLISLNVLIFISLIIFIVIKYKVINSFWNFIVNFL